ncbi:phenylalanine--tRNA ligase subunit alpha [bacterium]|nr:phenylalanine--tRNA ligase subunit alpha [bacterium]
MIDELEKIKSDFLSDADGKTLDRVTLDHLHAKYIGRNGVITQATTRLKEIPKDQKPQYGKILNEVKTLVEDRLASIRDELSQRDSSTPDIDLTLPERRRFYGHLHPITQTLEEIKSVFAGMGFTVEDGPEVETDYYNFEAVNIPKDHPARDMQDTFFISDNVVLRTHTTPVQARTMQRKKPPIRMICPGRVYRKDTPDATHMPFFHQVEGLVVDEGVTFADFKATIAAFVHKMFGSDIGTRFRPSYFSFTEPSAEVDISCIFCHGKGCRTCKNSGWIEIMGSGMVNPILFDYAKYEKNRYSGYAFGMGIERIAMFMYNVNDLRLFSENDLRFLEQF